MKLHEDDEFPFTIGSCTYTGRYEVVAPPLSQRFFVCRDLPVDFPLISYDSRKAAKAACDDANAEFEQRQQQQKAK